MKNLITRAGFVFLFLFSFGFLLPHTAPHVTTGDAAELALSGSTLGVAHSPGYPVFTLVNKMFGDALYFGNNAYRQNLISGLFLSLTLVVLGMIILLVSGQRWAVFLPLLLLSSDLFRQQALVTEVFPLTVFWGDLMLLSVLLFHKSKFSLPLLSFLAGVAMGIHHTLVLLIPALGFFLLNSRLITWKRIGKEFPLMAMFFLAGTSIYLYLPLRSLRQPVLDWEDPETWSRFWGVLTRARYGFFHLTQGAPLKIHHLSRLWDVIVFSKNVLVENIGWVGIAFLLFGSLQSLAYRFSRRWMVTLWIFIFLTGPFFYWLTNVSLTDGNDILARFSLLPLSAVMLLMSFALVPLWTSRLLLYREFMVALIFLFLSEAMITRSVSFAGDSPEAFYRKPERADGSMRWDLSLKETADNMVRMLPDKSILFADRADETEFSLAFMFGAENRKPQIRFVDCNAGVTRSIYGEDYYRIWGERRLKRREKIESKILEEATVPVFYVTLNPTMIDVFRTHRGLVYRAWPLDNVAEPGVTPWEKIVIWRFYPRELRGEGLYRTNLDLLARGLFERGRSNGAASMFGLAQRAGGANRYEMMGYWHQVRGELGWAQDFYRKAFSTGDISEALFSNLGALEMDVGRREEAAAIYRRGLKLYPRSVKLLYNLAVSEWRDGRTQESKALLNQIMLIDPKNAEAIQLLKNLKSNERTL